MSSQVIPAQIQVSAQDWHAWRAMYARAQAMAKEADALRKVLGLPETSALVALLGASQETPVSAVIVDGNGAPLGKVAVSYRPPYSVAGTFVSRVS